MGEAQSRASPRRNGWSGFRRPVPDASRTGAHPLGADGLGNDEHMVQGNDDNLWTLTLHAARCRARMRPWTLTTMLPYRLHVQCSRRTCSPRPIGQRGALHMPPQQVAYRRKSGLGVREGSWASRLASGLFGRPSGCHTRHSCGTLITRPPAGGLFRRTGRRTIGCT